MATQLLNAECDVGDGSRPYGPCTGDDHAALLQDLKHEGQRDYFRAIETVLQRTQPGREDDDEWDEKRTMANGM